MDLLDHLGIETPIVQAGMGGGISRHELAAAVSEAGGLGTVAVAGPAAIRRELAAARALTDRPIAVNVLLPFARRSWFEAAAGADAIVTFWGAPKRRAGGAWIHQCGSVAEARSAHAAGADAVIVQGVEAGGHVRGSVPALELLERVRAALPPDYPSDETILTELFGLSWPAPHRVIPNAATERQLGAGGEVPALNRALNRLSAPGARFTPTALQQRLIRAQRFDSRLLTPLGPIDDGPPNLLDAGPLYAGETVARIDEIRPAAEIVSALTP